MNKHSPSIQADLTGLSLDEVIDFANEAFRTDPEVVAAWADYAETTRIGLQLYAHDAEAFDALQRLAKRNMDVACQRASLRRRAMIENSEQAQRELV